MAFLYVCTNPYDYHILVHMECTDIVGGVSRTS
jgi:hypothetical protein